MDPALVRRDYEIMSGALCFSGTRVPTKNLFDYLEGASSLEEFLEDFPTVSRERGVTVLEAAQERSAEHDITTCFGLRSGRTCRDNFMATITLEITMIYTRIC